MFTGLFRRRESDVQIASVTPLDIQKQRQVDSLIKQIPSVCELLKLVSYRLDVNLMNNSSSLGHLYLNIFLPPHFPQVKPIITVSPSIQHPWVDEDQRIREAGGGGISVGCQELLNFSMHSDLGKLVLCIVEEFQKNLPQQTFGPSQFSKQLPYPISPSNGSHPLPNAVYTPGSGRTTLHLPFPQGSGYQCDFTHLPSSFPQLKEMSTEELQTLMEDEDRLQELIEFLPIMQKLSKEKEEIAQINEELAVSNLDKQPVLESHKKTILEMVDRVTTLRHDYDEYSLQHQSLSDQYSPAAIQENLKFAALVAEEESEKVAEEFLEGKLDIEEFLSKFMDKRTLGHNRRAKEEKLHQQLMELKKSGF